MGGIFGMSKTVQLPSPCAPNDLSSTTLRAARLDVRDVGFSHHSDQNSGLRGLAFVPKAEV
jgi:hypothetical protein